MSPDKQIHYVATLSSPQFFSPHYCTINNLLSYKNINYAAACIDNG